MKKNIKTKLEKKLKKDVISAEGHNKIEGRWVDVKMSSVKEDKENYICKGRIIVGQEDIGDDIRWKHEDYFKELRINKKRIK